MPAFGACTFSSDLAQMEDNVKTFPERNSNARYRHPEITLDEIIQANKQG